MSACDGPGRIRHVVGVVGFWVSFFFKSSVMNVQSDGHSIITGELPIEFNIIRETISTGLA